MKTTARLIITFDCKRNCDYCCNKYKKIISKAIPLYDLKDLKKYREVCITGGEPLLYPKRTIDILVTLKAINPETKLFLYTAKFVRTQEFNIILPLVDGIQYTLHKNSSMRDIDDFHAFQDKISKFNILFVPEKKSCRLYIHPEMPHPIKLIPRLWNRVEVKSWISEDACELPKNEVLYVMKEKNGRERLQT